MISVFVINQVGQKYCAVLFTDIKIHRLDGGVKIESSWRFSSKHRNCLSFNEGKILFAFLLRSYVRSYPGPAVKDASAVAV